MKLIKTFPVFFPVLLFSLAIWGNETVFKTPHPSLAHHLKGCPEDAICSPETSSLFIKWFQQWEKLKTIKEKNTHIKKHGFPFYFLSQKKTEKKDPLFASWHSKCLGHKEQGIFKSYGLVKKFQHSPHIIYQPFYLKNKKNWHHYQLPIGFSPMVITHHSLIGLVELRGKLLPFKFTNDGNFQLLGKIPKTAYEGVLEQTRTPCPSNIKSIPPLKNIFNDRYCKNILNEKKKKIISLNYWTCP